MRAMTCIAAGLALTSAVVQAQAGVGREVAPAGTELERAVPVTASGGRVVGTLHRKRSRFGGVASTTS